MMKKIFLMLAAAIMFAATAAAQQYIDPRIIPPEITRDAEIIPTGETNAICISNTGTPAPSITLCSTLALTGKTVLFKLPEYTVATLPASHPLAIVTDGINSTDATVGGGSTRVLVHWNGSAWAAIGGGGGVGDPGANGIAVRSALNTLIARTLTGTSGRITVTNGTGVAGNPTIDAGSDIPAKNTANTFTAANTFTDKLIAPLKVTPGDISLLTNGEIFIDGELVKYKSNGGTVYTLFKVGDPIVRVSSHASNPTFSNDDAAGYLLGDIWINTTTNKFCIAASVATGAAVWDCTGGSTPTLAQVLVSGRSASDAVDSTTAVKFGNGIVFWGLFCDSSNVCQYKIMDAAGTLIPSDWLADIDANKILALRDHSGTEIFKIDEATAAITKAKGLVGGFSLPIVTGATLTATDDAVNYIRIPYAQTITQVCAKTDTGTISVQLQRDDGSTTNMLSSSLVGATTEACTTSFVSGENVLSEGNYVDVLIVSIDSGSPTRLTVSAKTTRN